MHAVKKQGRNLNGFHLDAGTVIHAVLDAREDISDTNGEALCKTSPGRRSGGWYYPWQNNAVNKNADVTCKACMSKMQKSKPSLLDRISQSSRKFDSWPAELKQTALKEAQNSVDYTESKF